MLCGVVGCVVLVKERGVGVGRLGCGVLGLVCGSLCCAGWERFFF